jgi:Signal transduction histidine kinase
MDNWIIATKLFILLYCIIKYVSGDIVGGGVVLLFILLYICFNMAFYIFRVEYVKKLLLVASLLLLLMSAYFVDILFIFFVPLNCAELASRFSDDFKALLSSFILVFFIQKNMLPEYILVAVFTLSIFLISKKSFSRIANLTREIDALREKNDMLYKKLDMGVDYENQLKYLSQIEERNSLAQKIHDKVGHAIAGSLIQLEAAAVIIDKDLPKTREIIGNVINTLKDGMENIRSTLRNIKPAPEQLGINRLKTVLDEFSMNSGIKASLGYSGMIAVISHIQWKIIMDNVREALTNALKYSAASTLKVKLEVLNKLVRVEIKDNGTGAVTFKKGLGLRGIEERVENAGGNVIIDGSDGFSIIMLFPVTNN